MKTLEYKAWCALDSTDDLKKLPTLYQSKKDCIESNWSYFGHPCDDPLHRGIIAECEVTVKIKGDLKATKELREYYALQSGPILLIEGDPDWHMKAFAAAIKRKRAKMKKLRL